MTRVYHIIRHPLHDGWTFDSGVVRYRSQWKQRKPRRTALDVMIYLRSRSVPAGQVVWNWGLTGNGKCGKMNQERSGSRSEQ